MYSVYYNGNVLYSPTNANRLIHSGSADLSVGTAGKASFQIGTENTLLSSVKRMSGLVEIKENSDVLFRGRFVSDDVDLFGRHKLTAEGVLAALNDSIVPPYDFPSDYLLDPDYQTAAASGNVIAFWLGKLLAAHNAQVGNNQKIQLGTVTVTDPNNYITRSNDKHSTTWDTINSKFQGSTLGGYLVVRYTSTATYLDYLADFTTTNPQNVEFAKNLLDLSEQTNGADLFTAIMPIGKDGLTIESIPDETGSGYVKNGKIVYSTSAETAIGGRITKIVEWNDVGEVSNLFTKAIAKLSGAGGVPEKITVSACDLSGVDDSISPFRVGKNCLVKTPDNQTGTLYPLLEIKLDLLSKAKTKITFGGETVTFSAQTETQNAENQQTFTDIRGSISEVQQSSDDVLARVTTAESSILQNAADITSTVARVTEMGTQVESQLTQMRQEQDSFRLTVQNIQQNGVDKVVTSTGFSFDSSGMTVSKTGSQMATNIDEDGMEVTRSGEKVLTADSYGVNAINLTARQYLTIGKNSRFEDYQSIRTACFYTGV